jgi:hypothetical protein
MRNDKVTPAMIAQIRRMLAPENKDGFPLELGFACAHGRQGKYCADASTWDGVYDFYVKFEPDLKDDTVRKMAKITFFPWLQSVV